jgi:regulator of RNase E activity RraA
MDAIALSRAYHSLTTPHVADACMRLDVPVRQAPCGIRPLWEGTHIVGRVLPAQHVGSVDIFLEAINDAQPGDILVVDNKGRMDEACVGDLVALEAQLAQLAGIVILGLHRDAQDLKAIRLPIYSLGALPAGPAQVEPAPPAALSSAGVGDHVVTSDDFVLADDDGVLFLPLEKAAAIAELASAIRDTERKQAAMMRTGRSLRSQVRFDEYLAARAEHPLTFRQHLRAIGGAIEE